MSGHSCKPWTSALAEAGFELVARRVRESCWSSTEQQLRAEIAALGHGRVKPWRSEEKLATLAACWRLR